MARKATSRTAHAESSSGNVQFGKLSTMIGSQARQVDHAGRCHDAAAVRLDAALYELEQLRRELAAVVDPSLLVSTQRLLAAAAKMRAEDTCLEERPRASGEAGNAGSTEPEATKPASKASPAGSLQPAA